MDRTPAQVCRYNRLLFQFIQRFLVLTIFAVNSHDLRIDLPFRTLLKGMCSHYHRHSNRVRRRQCRPIPQVIVKIFLFAYINFILFCVSAPCVQCHPPLPSHCPDQNQCLPYGAIVFSVTDKTPKKSKCIGNFCDRSIHRILHLKLPTCPTKPCKVNIPLKRRKVTTGKTSLPRITGNTTRQPSVVHCLRVEFYKKRLKMSSHQD